MDTKNDDIEQRRKELEEKISAYQQLFELGNTNPTEEQARGWLTHHRDRKTPKTIKEATYQLEKKCRLYEAVGLPERAEKLRRYAQLKYPACPSQEIEPGRGRYPRLREALGSRLEPLCEIVSRDTRDPTQILVIDALRNTGLELLLRDAWGFAYRRELEDEDFRQHRYGNRHPCYGGKYTRTSMYALIKKFSDSYVHIARHYTLDKETTSSWELGYSLDKMQWENGTEARVYADFTLARALRFHTYGNNPNPKEAHRKVYSKLRKREYDAKQEQGGKNEKTTGNTCR